MRGYNFPTLEDREELNGNYLTRLRSVRYGQLTYNLQRLNYLNFIYGGTLDVTSWGTQPWFHSFINTTLELIFC